MRKYLKIIIFLFFALIITTGLIYHAPIFSFLFKKQTFTYHTLSNNTDKDLNYYYQKTQGLAQQSNQSTATFLATGDIMLSRNVALQISKASNPLLPFRQMTEILKAVDFSFANLESPFAENNSIIGGHSMIFAAPKENVQGLKDYNFQIVNLANNHAMDLGLVGLNFTKKYLDGNQIQHIGAGDNLEQAWQPAMVESSGIKICFVGASFSSVNDSGKAKNDYVARIEDVQNLKSEILSAKGGSAFGGKSTCDFIVASMHAGVEYTRGPNQAQIAFAHAAIDAGADLVIGAHPHWVQTIERYCPNSATILDSPSPIHGEGAGGEVIAKQNCANPKYIFYSLGNFIFDQMWSQDTKEGLTLKITVSKNVGEASGLPQKGGQWPPLQDQSPTPARIDDLQGTRIPAKLEKIDLIPVVIDNYSTPRPANEAESKKILEKINIKDKILY